MTKKEFKKLQDITSRIHDNMPYVDDIEEHEEFIRAIQDLYDLVSSKTE